ncbi:sensor histidine kinase [Arthrobacter tecti]
MPVQSSIGAAVTGELVLRILRLGLHIGFAVLLTVGTVRMLLSEPGSAGKYGGLVLAGTLAAVYLVGTLAEKRAAEGRPIWGIVDAGRYGPAWLAVITGLWAFVLVIHPDFSWLAFPLFFLHLHLLKTGHAIVAVAAITVVVMAAQWYHNGELHIAMVLGPVLGAGFAVIMGLAYQALHAESVNQRRALQDLHRTRTELARSQHEAGALAERERLAREIHDTLAQGLSSIVLISRAADAALEADQADLAQERVRIIHATAAENLTEARRFVRGLSTGHIEEGSLIQSLRRTCESTERQAAARGQNLRCRFKLDGEPILLPAPYEVALLRAAQSAMSNVAIHAQASTSVLSLSFVGSDVTLDVFDDGIGFNAAETLSTPTQRPDGSGFGLISIRERVAALNGSLDIESTPGEGTVVAIRLPLAEHLGDAETDTGKESHE